MLEGLATRLPAWRTVGASAGLHVLARLPAGTEEATVVRLARQAGVQVYGLERYRAVPGERGGIVFGYAAVDERRIATGLQRLAEALDGGAVAD